MSMRDRLTRPFLIRTRFEAWAVIWAIALGAAERGKHYLSVYPGGLGWMFFAICLLVVIVAGPKLLDSVRPVPAKVATAGPRARRVSRNRPTKLRRPAGSASPSWSRRG
jgi:hypothetical protein